MQGALDLSAKIPQISMESSLSPFDIVQQLAQADFFDPQHKITPTTIYHIASSCVASAFVFSQYRGALERIAQWAPHHPDISSLKSGHAFATLGISQLSTSHQHQAPTLRAEQIQNGWKLQGFSPWVTGAHHAQHFILGAHNTDAEHLLFWVPKEKVQIDVPWHLTALNECDTAKVSIDAVVPTESLLHRTTTGNSTQTGSLRSAAMALGIVAQSLSIIAQQAQKRPALLQSQKNLQQKLQTYEQRLCHTTDRIGYRFAVNQLALSSAQQALVATKGKGFLHSENASTLCQQALFFLVWSCPEAVQYQHLGIG